MSNPHLFVTQHDAPQESPLTDTQMAEMLVASEIALSGFALDFIGHAHGKALTRSARHVLEDARTEDDVATQVPVDVGVRGYEKIPADSAAGEWFSAESLIHGVDWRAGGVDSARMSILLRLKSRCQRSDVSWRVAADTQTLRLRRSGVQFDGPNAGAGCGVERG